MKKDNDAQKKVDNLYSNFKDNLKSILEKVEVLDPTIKENQIRGFTAAAINEIHLKPQEKTVDVLTDKRFDYLLNRMNDENNIAPLVTDLVNQCRADLIAIVNE